MTRCFAFLTIALFGSVVCPAGERKVPFSSGVYGDLTIAVDSFKGRISGFFESEGGDSGDGNPAWVCKFYFSGKEMTSGRAAIVALTYFPSTRKFDSKRGEVINTLSPEGRPRVRIHFSEYPLGCARGEDFSSDSPHINQDEAQSLTEIRMVIADRARFYSSPDQTRVERRYVVRGDLINVIEKNGTFLKASYGGDAGVITGWLKESDLHSLD